jgi:hypothetical protein
MLLARRLQFYKVYLTEPCAVINAAQSRRFGLIFAYLKRPTNTAPYSPGIKTDEAGIVS